MKDLVTLFNRCIRLLFIFFILNGLILNGTAQGHVEFDVSNLKKEINSLSDVSISFKLYNNSNSTLLIPNVLSINNLFKKENNLNVVFELYRVLENRSFKLLDSCFIRADPIYPEEGVVINKFGKGTVFIYESRLPVNCIYKTGQYKIRYTFFIRDTKGKKRTIKSKWYCFKVNYSLI